MGKIFGRGEKKRKEEERQHYEREVAYGESQRPPFPSEYIQSIGQSYYAIADPEVINILRQDEQLKYLLVAYSPLNRLSHTDKREKEIDEILHRRLLLIHKINMIEQEYGFSGWAILESFRLFGRGVVTDPFQGFKAQMMVKQLRAVEVMTGPKLKRRQGT